MNKLVSKIINVVLALISIVCFLALDFYGFGSSKNFTGADVMEMIEDGEEIYYISNPALGLWADPAKF